MNKIKPIVMRRVQFIRTFRPLVSDIAAATVLFLLALYGIGHEVWVAQVVANMPPLFDIAAVAKFFVAAFLNTEFFVQVLALAVVATGIWLARGVGYTLAQSLTQVRA